MNRTTYNAQRAVMRTLKRKQDLMRLHNRMADSRLVVQMMADEDILRDLQRHIDAIRMGLPSSGTDPLGFRTMYQNWQRRRSHVEYRCRARRRDAAMMARHVARVRAQA